jgi:FkbM family methyltransferase
MPNMTWLERLRINTILDCGANTGQFYGLARTLWPRAKIYSFEPLPGAYDILSRRCSNDPNLFTYRYAISDKAGQLDFNVSSFDQSSSALVMADLHKECFPFSADHNAIRVEAVTLDEIVERAIELGDSLLVKFDVQGFEDKAIRGAEKTLKQAKVCFIETSFQQLYLGQPLFIDILNQMSGLGFTYFGNTFGVLAHPENGSPLEEDSIFVSQSVLESI